MVTMSQKEFQRLKVIEKCGGREAESWCAWVFPNKSPVIEGEERKDLTPGEEAKAEQGDEPDRTADQLQQRKYRHRLEGKGKNCLNSAL
jgi:hypothetical protein